MCGLNFICATEICEPEVNQAEQSLWNASDSEGDKLELRAKLGWFGWKAEMAVGVEVTFPPQMSCEIIGRSATVPGICLSTFLACATQFSSPLTPKKQRKLR